MDIFNNRMDRMTGGSKIPFRAILSYLFDYGIIVVLAVAYAVIDKIVTPFKQPFSLENISLKYPMADPERIPIWLAMVYSCACPAGVIALYTMFLDGIFSHHKNGSRMRWTFGERMWELNCGILGLFLSQGAAFVITGSLKNLIGKPRPDLIARCMPPPDARDPLFGLSTVLICTQTDTAIMQDGFRSFPSGHSSSSFAGLFYLSLYLAAKLHVLDQRGEVWRTTIVLIPSLGASCIAASRIMDARHHPFDVLFGSAMGILVAWASYRQYFPSVSDTRAKGRAYPMRTWGVQNRDRRPDRTADIVAEHSNYDHNVSMEPLTYNVDNDRGRNSEQKPYSYNPEEREMMNLPTTSSSSTIPSRRPINDPAQTTGLIGVHQKQQQPSDLMRTDPPTTAAYRRGELPGIQSNSKLRSLTPTGQQTSSQQQPQQRIGRQPRDTNAGVESLPSSDDDDEPSYDSRLHQPRLPRSQV